MLACAGEHFVSSMFHERKVTDAEQKWKTVRVASISTCFGSLFPL